VATAFARHGSDRFAGSWTGSLGGGPIRGSLALLTARLRGRDRCSGWLRAAPEAWVGEWLDEQSEAFRNVIKIVVIDP
jgi:hypothetical protein